MTAVETPHVDRTSPFVGLETYDHDDADIFFGRDDERKVLISNLRASRLTLLYARSGTGKSSLLRAGVAPRLLDLADRSQAERGSARNIPVVFSSWHDDPTDALIEAIDAAIATRTQEGPPTELSRNSVLDALRAASATTGATLLVILDQFEEYLLARSREDPPGRFADEIAACVRRADLRANFLIAIREDAYSGLGDLFKSRIDNVYGNYLHLEDLSLKCARDAITLPVGRINDLHPELAAVEIEPELVDAVLDELSHPEEATLHDRGVPANGASDGHHAADIPAPYLQLVMKRLWDAEVARAATERPKLHLQTLSDLGGAGMIVRTHVDRALDSLPESDQDAALDVFQHLVTRSGTKVALTASDLLEYTNRPQPELQDLLERLTRSDARILHDVPPVVGGTESRFEISHDLLAPAILTWRVRRRADRLERERNAAEQHAQDEARRAEAEQRRARRFRMMAAALSVVVIALTILGLVALGLWRTTVRDKHDANARQAAEQALVLATVNPQKALKQSVGAAQESTSGPVVPTLRTVAPTALRLARVIHGPRSATLAQFSGNSSLATFAAPKPGSGTFDLWSLRTGRPVFAVPRSGSGSLTSVVLGGQGRVAVTLYPIPGSTPPRPGGPARLWNLTTHRAVARLGGHVEGAAVSFDERRIITWNPASVTLWSESGSHIAKIMPGAVSSAALSRNHRFAAVLTQGGGPNHPTKEVSIWNIATPDGRPALLQGGISVDPASKSLVFGPGGQLATYGGSGVTVLRPDNPRPLRLKPQSQAQINTLVFDSAGTRIVTAGEDGLARVYDAANGILGTTMPISASTKAAVISTDGELVATAGNDGTARIWNATSGVPSLILAGNGSPLASVAFNSTGTRLATTAGDGTIRLWSIEPRHKQSVRGAVFDARIDPADRNVVGIADVYRQPYLWYMDSGTLFPLPSTRSNGFAFSNNGSLFVTTTRRSGKVPHALLWNTQQPDHPVTSVPLDLRPNDSRLAPMTIVFHHPSFSPDQKSVVFATSVGAVIWRPGIHTGNPLSNPFSNAPGQTVAAAYSPDGREIVTGGPDGLSLWQVPTNKLSGGSPATPTQHRLFALKHAAQVVAAAFSSGGHFVASGDTLGRISVWSVASGKVFHHIRVPAIPTDIWFSPRGRRLLISATDGTVRVWDWKSGIFLAPLQLHAGATRAAQYVPGHPNEILSAGDDGLVEISECPTCVSIPALEDLAKRHFDRLHTHKPR